MMKTSHPIDELELMAYLDGELPRDRATVAAAHLEGCRDCQEMAAAVRGTSQQLAEWQVTPQSTEITPAMITALEEHGRKAESAPKRRTRRSLKELFVGRRAWGWAAAAVAVALAIIFVPGPMRMREFQASRPQGEPMGVELRPADNTDGQSHSGSKKVPAEDVNGNLVGGSFTSLARMEPGIVAPSRTRIPAQESTGSIGKLIKDQPRIPHGQPEAPMVVRTANLAIATKDFDHSRAGLEEILKRYHGYFGQLTVSGETGSGRTLAATIRVPADKLDAAISDLKGLGLVQSESQNGEEVTQQYVDLEARLLNSRHTEQRLSDLLRERTGRLSDVLEVEQEIDRVRGEIEQMDAEKRELSKRVTFATIETQLREDYKAELQIVPTSTATRLRNAAVQGYETLVAGLINLGLFLASWGPALLLWGALLFFAARFAWKRYRQRDLI